MYISLIGAVMAFVINYASASMPISLYMQYSEFLHLSNGDLALSSIIYFLGTVVALMVLSKISNHIGRKKTIIVTLLLSLVASLLFMFVNSTTVLMIGRLLQGLACGLGASTISTYIMELRPHGNATALISSAPMVGLAIGPVFSGSLVQYVHVDLYIPFAIAFAIIVVTILLMVAGRETVSVKPISMTIFKPNVVIPKSIRTILPQMIAIFVATWSIGGLFQAFSASMAQHLLGFNDAVLAAIIFLLLQLPNMMGSKLSNRFTAKISQLSGMVAFTVSLVMLAISYLQGWTIVFLLSTIVLGITWGLAYTAMLNDVVTRIPMEMLTSVMSFVYIVSYLGAMIPNMVLVKMIPGQSLEMIMIEYTGVVVVCMLVVIYQLLCHHYKESTYESEEIIVSTTID